MRDAALRAAGGVEAARQYGLAQLWMVVPFWFVALSLRAAERTAESG